MPGRAVRSRLAGVLAVGLGVWLLTLTLPRAAADLTRMPGAAVPLRLQAGEPPSSGDLALFAAAELRARTLHPEPGRDFALALAALAEAGPARMERYRGPRGRLQLDAAARHLALGLARSPARPAAWTRLAAVRFRRGQPRRAVIDALRMALKTGPSARHLAPVRSELAMRVGWRSRQPLVANALKLQHRLARFQAPELARRLRAAGKPSQGASR